MLWECSECGDRVIRRGAPLVCGECGTAGPVFVAAERGLEGAIDSDDLREAWVRAGVMQASASRRPTFARGSLPVNFAAS
jgi:hypothetical protein